MTDIDWLDRFAQAHRLLDEEDLPVWTSGVPHDPVSDFLQPVLDLYAEAGLKPVVQDYNIWLSQRFAQPGDWIDEAGPIMPDFGVLELQAISTAIHRGERWSNGFLRGALASGLLAALLDRLEADMNDLPYEEARDEAFSILAEARAPVSFWTKILNWMRRK